MKFGLQSECRNPPEWHRPTGEVYADTIDALVAAESLGFEFADFLEHHFTDDGYLPSPLMMASAVAGRTKTMHVCTNIAILPLYEPVRFAEDTAVLDCISNGRLELGLALGYRPQEYAGYRVDLKTRGARADEALEIIRGLWRGECVTFHGRHFQIDGVKISPLPVQHPNPTLWLGGFSPPAFRRAAKYGDGYSGPASENSFDGYREALRKADKDPASARFKSGYPGNLVVSNDPERTFALLAPHVVYFVNSYAKWFEDTDTKPWNAVHSEEELKASGMLTVLTPEEAVKQIGDLTAKFPMEAMTLPLAPPGVPAHRMMEYLELFAAKVIPHFR
jgi:alkanesulfonate monooxygenase SsuD/methylene tetrahydromethanopterin reductase-like flavin-dependent oxidoreductase (luciferase family)